MNHKTLKTILGILLIFGIGYTLKSQEYSKIEKDTLQYYNENQYKDWEIDPAFLAPYPERDRFLKKGDDRVRITSDEKTIRVEKRNIKNPYKNIYVYFSKTKSLFAYGKSFYSCPIGIDKEYDENGKLIKEIDLEKPFKISVEDLTKLMKQKLNIDLMDVSQRIGISRTIGDNRPYYLISIPDKLVSRILRTITIDATTGDIISDEIVNPPNKYSPDWIPPAQRKNKSHSTLVESNEKRNKEEKKGNNLF